MSLRSIDKEQITVADTAVGFTDAKVHNTSTLRTSVLMSLVRVSTATAGSPSPIRISCTGTAPTDALGVPFDDGDMFEVWGEPDLTRFRAIRTTAISATLDVEYFGEG